MILLRLGLLILLTSSCSKQSPWCVNSIPSGKEEFCSTKLTFHSSEPTNEIDVEFVRDADQVQAYLTIHSLPIAPLKNDPHSASISIRTNQRKISSKAYRFKGGQRFLLTPEISKELIELLKSKQEITILLSGYRTVLKPEDFKRKYEAFLNPPFLRNPLQFSL